MPNWKKIVVSGSDAILNSLYVTGSVTGSVFTGSFTGSLFGTASWARNSVTASYALNAGSSGVIVADEGAVQGPATFLNFIGAGVTVTISSNTASINITGGAGAAFPYTGSAQITGSLGVTGSVTATNFTGSLLGTASYALTASYADNFTVKNFLYIDSASLDYQQNLSVATGSFQTIASVATGSYRCAFFDYVTFSGSTVRAGTVVSTWSGSATEYYENYTNDIGGSTAVVDLRTVISGSNIQLQAGISGSAWSVRSLVRLL